MEKSAHVTTTRFYCCCLAAVVLMMLAGCSSLTVVETWHKPGEQGHRYQKLMILGIGNDENYREMFERFVVVELSRGRVTAVPSYTFIPDLDKTNRDGVVAAVRAAGCDAVLTTRTISAGDSTVAQQGTYGYVYGANPVGNYGDYEKASLQTNLYDAATEELVWSSTIKTFDADNKARVSSELGRYFLENLRKDGFI